MLQRAGRSLLNSRLVSKSYETLLRSSFLQNDIDTVAESISCAPSPQMAEDLLSSVASNRPPVVFYHYPCPDGVFAALAATLHYRSKGVQPRYIPFEVYRHIDPAELQLQSNSVAFLLDYCGPSGFPQQLAQHVAAVIALDHHKTAAQQLADVASHPANLHVQLDMQRSGAAIARDFFKPPGMSNDVQHMFRMVEDADLWRWALPGSQAFQAGLAALKLEYSALQNPAIFDQLLALQPTQVIAEGQLALQRQEQLIDQVLAAARPFQLGGVQGLTRGWGACLGCLVQGDLVKFRSSLGNKLATKSAEQGLAPVGLVAYTEADMPNRDTHIKVSLRSINNFDTSAVSEAFGGGGHAAASSCILKQSELDGWRAMAT